MSKKYPHVNAANKYARDVVKGKIPASWQIIAACQNHLTDLKKSKKKSFRYEFDKEKGEAICEFAELLPHVKGEWQGTNIVLESWQCFAFAVPIGWIRKTDGLRRYREISFFQNKGKAHHDRSLYRLVRLVQGAG